MSTDTIINPAVECAGVVRTIKANYSKMGERNLLFSPRTSFYASGVMTEYS